MQRILRCAQLLHSHEILAIHLWQIKNFKYLNFRKSFKILEPGELSSPLHFNFYLPLKFYYFIKKKEGTILIISLIFIG